MSIVTLMNTTVLRKKYVPGFKDSFGTPFKMYLDDATINARVQPVSAKENIQAGRKATKITYKVYIEPGITIYQKDKINYNSNDYDIVEKIDYQNDYIRLVIVQQD